MRDSRLVVIAVVAGDTNISRADLPQNIDVFMSMDTQRIRLWERGKNKTFVSNHIYVQKPIAHAQKF